MPLTRVQHLYLLPQIGGVAGGGRGIGGGGVGGICYQYDKTAKKIINNTKITL